jgi:predicted nucleic acid-binding Zn ribbon protein
MALLEVADVLRQFAPSYLDAFGERLLASHRRAIDDIMACRTAAMGGHAYTCDDCGKHFHVYHGCRNRSCPACHTHQTQQWLDARTVELLPCAYYHVTVTVPAQLRDTLRSNQSDGYRLLMKAAAEAVIALCRDKRYMGATPAILAVLHTWTAAIDYHPHVHLLVSGGGIGQDGASWREAKHPFLVPVRALSRLVRGKFHDALKKERPDLEAQLPADVWTREWVAWCKPWGKGETAVLYGRA